MTNTEKLAAAGWIKVRTRDECGEALTTRADLIGLACEKRGAWIKSEGDPARCAQHAAALIETGE